MPTRAALLAALSLVAAAGRAGVLDDPAFFPTAVWCQDPVNAEKYKAVGINLYVALWQGPTEAQLAALTKAGLPVICEQNAVGRRHRQDPIIAGWMHGDEPDNAQELAGGKGYGPPIPPAKVVAEYAAMKRADPSRPVLLNLGQGVAWDDWVGRGVRTHHPEDYAAYAKGADLVSFDIYPVVHDAPAVKGKLEFVPFGVMRLQRFIDHAKPVWACIETTRIGNPDAKPTPAQIRSEAWMAVIAGAKGLIYFAHQFKPLFVEAGLLADPAVAAAVGTINADLHRLAPVLNSPEGAGAVTVASMDPRAPVLFTARSFGGDVYAFVCRPGDRPADYVLTVSGMQQPMYATVDGESRVITLGGNDFADTLPAYGTRIYRIKVGFAPR